MLIIYLLNVQPLLIYSLYFVMLITCLGNLAVFSIFFDKEHSNYTRKTPSLL